MVKNEIDLFVLAYIGHEAHPGQLVQGASHRGFPAVCVRLPGAGHGGVCNPGECLLFIITATGGVCSVDSS